jgi:hypothetical protein
MFKKSAISFVTAVVPFLVFHKAFSWFCDWIKLLHMWVWWEAACLFWLLGDCCWYSPTDRSLLSSVCSTSISAALRGAKKFRVGSSSCDSLRCSVAPAVGMLALFVWFASSSEDLCFRLFCSLKLSWASICCVSLWTAFRDYTISQWVVV